MATYGVLNKRVEKLYKYHKQAETLVKKTQSQIDREVYNHKEKNDREKH